MANKESVFTSPSFRVFEYVANDGTTYWSFTRSDRLISPLQRLVLQDRLGVPVPLYAARLRTMAQEFLEGPDSTIEEDLITEESSAVVE